MAQLASFRVGHPDEWDDFAKRNQSFLERLPALIDATKIVFAREFHSDNPVDLVVSYLGRVCVEDFMEIQLLAANGYGIAATELLRGMYERVVTASYLHQHPDEVDAYLDYHVVQMGRLARAIMETFQGFIDPETLKTLEPAVNEYQRMKGRFRRKDTWSRMDFVGMAKSTGTLGRYVVPAYYVPLAHAHATVHSWLARVEGDATDGPVFRDGPQRKEADSALMMAHNLLLGAVAVAGERFKLDGLEEAFATSS